jgi:hypothetical protein
MTISDINSNLTQVSVSGIAARTTTLTTSAVDLRSYKGGLIVQQLVGVVSGTTPTLDGKIQTSVDGSTGWTDISGATFTQVTATDSFQKIGFVENQTLGYIRYVGTIAGTTPSFTMGVVFLGSKERV